MSLQRLLTWDFGLFIQGTAWKRWKCRSTLTLGQVRVCLCTIHAHSIFSPIYTLCSRSAKLAERWCEELHDVQPRVLLWESKQSPTWEITVTNGDRPDLFLPRTCFPSSVFLYILHPPHLSDFQNSIQKCFINMTDNSAMVPMQNVATIGPSFSWPLCPYVNVVFQSNFIFFIGTEALAKHLKKRIYHPA